jgi:hypothetical protein
MRVRLTSGDGTVVILHPLQYQFGPSSEPRDWDANWLVISGHVELPDGRSWSFTDPCLTTWEARELGLWLRRVLSGDVQPAAINGEEDENLLIFTEPNVAFSLASRGDGSATIRVHFSVESSPPWLQGGGSDEGAESYEFFVEAQLAQSALVEAIASWDHELAAFPIR